MQPLGAVGEHRRGRFAQVEPSRIHLADVRDQDGFAPSRLRECFGEAAKKVVIRN
jgi:hypothetical protein